MTTSKWRVSYVTQAGKIISLGCRTISHFQERRATTRCFEQNKKFIKLVLPYRINVAASKFVNNGADRIAVTHHGGDCIWRARAFLAAQRARGSRLSGRSGRLGIRLEIGSERFPHFDRCQQFDSAPD